MHKHIVSISDYPKGPGEFHESAHGPSEHRRAVRYNVALRAVYRWTEGGTSRQSAGITRDVSSRGAYVIATDRPAPGATIEMKISVLAGRRGRSVIWANAAGRVSRVDSELAAEDNGGFAVESEGSRLFRR